MAAALLLLANMAVGTACLPDAGAGAVTGSITLNQPVVGMAGL